MFIKAREIPNLITLFRIALIPPTIWAMLEGRFDLALILFAVAGISDGVDGYLAKRFNWQSKLGGMLDPIADKLLLIACYVVLGWLTLIPWWLVAAVIIRDVVIVIGAIIYYYRIEEMEADPSWLSKINTFVQIVYVIGVIASQSFLNVSQQWMDYATWLVLATTVASGVNYVLVWGRRATHVVRERHK